MASPDIFISYSSTDRARALSLADFLRGEGHSVWIDTEAISGAKRWRKEIAQALTECKVFLLLVSGASLASENVQKELTIAAEEHKHLLPIDIEKVPLTVDFRYHLAGVQHITIEEPEKIADTILKLTQAAAIQTKQLSHDPNEKTIRVAVLPFDDLSPQHDNEWFADGMMDELISTLGGLKDLRVPSRSDVIYYKKHHPKAREIARDLGVRYLIEGAVRKGGEKIRINASLFDAYQNQQLWSDKYDGTFDDIFQFQESVSTSITDALKLKLTPPEAEKVRERPTDNAEAYELYLKGLEFHRLLTRDGYEKAMELYEQAVKLDPKFADAYIAIAGASATYYRECSRDPKWLRRAEENLAKAEAITGETVRTLWAMGEIAWQKNDLGGAEKILLHSLKLDSKYYQTYNMLGNVYTKQNNLEKAGWAFEEAVHLSPTHQNYSNLIIALSSLNDRKRLIPVCIDAMPIIRKQLDHWPNDLNAHVNLASALFWSGHNDDALAKANELADRDDLDGLALFNLGTIYGHLKIDERSIDMFRRSVHSGFREIEAFLNLQPETSEIQKELEEIVQELQLTIQEEASMQRSSL